MRKMTIPLLTIGTILFFCLLVGIVFRFMGVFQTKEDVRASNFPLVMALKLYKQARGEYPKSLQELRQELRGFDPSPFAKYRFDTECITAPSVCVEKGKHILSDTYPFGFCNFDLDRDVDFVCGD